MKECPSCNTMLEDDELYCHECGTKQEIEEVVAQNEELTTPLEKKCIHCGETIEKDSFFCPFCGKSQIVEKPLSDEEVDEEEQKPEVEEDVQAQEPEEESAATLEEPLPSTPTKKEDKKSGKGFLILLYSIFALVALAIVGYAVYVTQEDDNKTASEVSEVTDEDSTDGATEKVREIYGELIPSYFANNIGSPFEKYCTTEWNELVKAEYEGLQRSGGDIGVLDFDLWICGQDWGDDLALVEAKEKKVCSKDSVWVLARVRNLANENDITLVMKRENGEWKVDDFRYNDGESMKEALRNTIVEYKWNGTFNMIDADDETYYVFKIESQEGSAYKGTLEYGYGRNVEKYTLVGNLEEQTLMLKAISGVYYYAYFDEHGEPEGGQSDIDVNNYPKVYEITRRDGSFYCIINGEEHQIRKEDE